MFSKVLMACLVLYTVQVLGASIKGKLSPEVQHVAQEIDMKSLLLEAEIKKAANDKKHDQDTVKLNTRLALKQLKSAVKEGKDTLCGQVANLQMKAVEQRADEVKLCNNKLDLKELQQDLHGYLKNLNAEAKLVDKYCAFIHTDAAEAAQCVADSVAALRAKLEEVETVISVGMTKYISDSEACYKSIVDDVQLEAGRIQIELSECLHPTTAAPAVDSSSSSQAGSSESKESHESNESGENGSGSSETTDAPAEPSSEGGNDGEEGGEDQATEGDNNGEDGNDAEGTTAAPSNEGGDNDGVTNVEDDGEVPAEKEPVASEETPAENNGDGETPVEDNNKEEGDAPSSVAPVEDTNVTEGEAPAEDNNDKEAGQVPAEDNNKEDTPAEENSNNDANAEEKSVEASPAGDDTNINIPDEEIEHSIDFSEHTADEKVVDNDEINIEY